MWRRFAARERRFETRVRQSIDQFVAGNRADDDEDVASTHGGMGADPSVDSPPEINELPATIIRMHSSSSFPRRLLQTTTKTRE